MQKNGAGDGTKFVTSFAGELMQQAGGLFSKWKEEAEDPELRFQQTYLQAKPDFTFNIPLYRFMHYIFK